MYQLIEPYTAGLETKKNESTEPKLSLQGSQMKKVEVGVGPTSGLRGLSTDIESKEIKNIYVDCKPLTCSFDIRSGFVLKESSFQNRVYTIWYI